MAFAHNRHVRRVRRRAGSRQDRSRKRPRPRFGLRACQEAQAPSVLSILPSPSRVSCSRLLRIRGAALSLAIRDAPGRHYRIPDLIFIKSACMLIVRLGGGAMSYRRALVVALVLAVPGAALAKSGYVRPPEPKLVHTTAPMPKISSPALLHRVVHHCGPRRPC